MEITRRDLIGAGAAVGAGVLLPLKLSTAATAAVPQDFRPPRPPGPPVAPFTESLPTLKEMGVIDATRGRSATIRMVSATHAFSKDVETPTFAYRSTGGSQDYLGPVIIAKRNVPFTLTVVNELGAHPLAGSLDPMLMGTVDTDATAPRAAVHLHGGNTAPASDGDPLDFFPQGTQGRTKRYTYENTQEAAGLWYHDHAYGITRLNVMAGLAGGYLLRDANDTGDGSRLPGSPYEVPLVVQDRTFSDDGTALLYPEPYWEPEFFGDEATVNGKVTPNLNVDRGKYRFRVVNGSNARFYNFRFQTGTGDHATALEFFQIGTDGGLLDRPVSLEALLLAPGERADLIVDFEHLKPHTHVVLTNDANAPYPNETPEALLSQIMQFTVTGHSGWTKTLTTRTNLRSRTAPITRLDHVKPDVTRPMSLVEVHDLDGNPTMVLMNNRNFDPEDTTMAVGTNTLEQWDVINTTVDAHPMHLHFAQFQILNRQKFDSVPYSVAAGYVTAEGASTGPGNETNPRPPVDSFLIPETTYLPAPNERGWKDTVVCLPGEVTRILIPFGPKAVPVHSRWGRTQYLPMAIGTAHTGKYVSHCHILEHEENDMMMRFTIV